MLNVHGRIRIKSVLRCSFGLVHPNLVATEQLPHQYARLHDVGVIQYKLSDSRSREHGRHRRADRAASKNYGMSAFPPGSCAF